MINVIVIDKIDLTLLGFVFSTMIINCAYAINSADYYLFMRSSAYYIYNFLFVIIVRDFVQSKPFLRFLLWASVFNLLLQLMVLLLGIGRYFWGIFRFMGTFNDPNQFSFSMFTSFLIVYILSSYFKDQEHNRKKLIVFMMFALATFFIIQGSSTGMLLGIVTFIVLFILSVINSERTPAFTLLKVCLVLLFAAILIFVLTRGFAPANVDGSIDSSSFLISRLFEKVDKVEGGGLMALMKERGIDKLFTNPMYLFFGAGEGGFLRFPNSVFEIHSTFPGILFYYGIFPFLLLCRWLWFNLKNINIILIPAYLALLVESFTLANQRQPAVWLIIILGSMEYINTHEPRKYRIVKQL